MPIGVSVSSRVASSPSWTWAASPPFGAVAVMPSASLSMAVCSRPTKRRPGRRVTPPVGRMNTLRSRAAPLSKAVRSPRPSSSGAISPAVKLVLLRRCRVMAGPGLQRAGRAETPAAHRGSEACRLSFRSISVRMVPTGAGGLGAAEAGQQRVPLPLREGVRGRGSRPLSPCRNWKSVQRQPTPPLAPPPRGGGFGRYPFRRGRPRGREP